jgi:heme-degrading monooxygenase HmoA
MYLRFLRLRVRDGQEAAFVRFYEERVIPALADTTGCLFAGLLAPWRSETHQSLTIWESAEHAAAYADSGLYDRLLAEAAPMLADTAEWRVRLSRDPTETIDPTRREPPSEGFEARSSHTHQQHALDAEDGHPFVRIVVVRVAFGRVDDFLATYRAEVIPALERVPGCRGVFLAEGEQEGEVLSITIWDREEDAVRYEMSGEFERLTAQLAGTFNPLYDWRARLGQASAGRPEITSYQLVQGRRLGPSPSTPPPGSSNER